MKIDAGAKSIRDLLDNKRYGIDYYQREYKWQTKQIEELLSDLEEKFLDNYDAKHERSEVEKYGHYFLGSVITSNRDGKKFIIDGQQRLTSLTLLLIYLNNLQKEQEDKVNISSLIFSVKYGAKAFNLDVEERRLSMEALFNGETPEKSGQSEGVQNIVDRYADIERKFSSDLKEKALPYFIDWFVDNVDFVEITASSDEEAYTIFETMNDRGLSLTPTDMLKGYLLSRITDPVDRNKANDVWKNRLLELSELGKEEDADFIKAWLRAKFAQTSRDRKKGAINRDFEEIATTFHKWVHENEDQINLRKSQDFRDLILKNFEFFSRQYLLLRRASLKEYPGLEYVYYNAYNNFTLQYPLILSAIVYGDDDDTIGRKIRLVSGYIDIVIARRHVNFYSLGYSNLVYNMFLLMKEIRNLTVNQLGVVLKKRVSELEESFDGMRNFHLTQFSRRYIPYLLARLTHYVEKQSHYNSKLSDYLTRDTKAPFEIEHIWADKFQRHTDEFANEIDFHNYRNRIGGLILLPKPINASLNDEIYENKLPIYYGQNLLAQSLNLDAYKNNPRFLAFINQSGLPFKAHATFKKADLDARQELYRLIAEEVWNPSRLDKELV